jgi:hypothetical protein
LEGKNQRKSDVEASNSKGKELKKEKAKADREYMPSKKKLRSTEQRRSVFYRRPR